MSQTVYTIQILPAIKKDMHRFILEEDNNSGHTGGRATKWKLDHEIEYYFNVPKSPGLPPIENIWQLLRFHYN